MIDDTAIREVSRRESSGSWLLWFGLVGAPLAWFAQLLVTYSLEEWFACSPGATTQGEILGVDSRAVAVIVSVVLVGIALLAGAASLSCLRRTPAGTDDISRRRRWMAVAGIMNSVLYLIVMALNVTPALLLDVCGTSP